MDTTERQQIIDDEHLRLLRIGYFIAGGTSIFAGLIGLVYLGLGAFFGVALSQVAETNGDENIAEITIPELGNALDVDQEIDLEQGTT